MAQPHLAPGQLGSVLPLGDKLAQTPSYALLKAPQLEVIRVVLLAGKTMPGHQVAGEITVQCLEGTVEFSSGADKQTLRAGELVYLKGDVLHALRGIEDASVLVTIVANHQS